MRTISTITIILWCAITNAQIESHGKIELGYKNGVNGLFYEKTKSFMFEYPANTFYADLSLEFKWKFIKFNQDLKNNFNYENGRTFSPIDIEFISCVSFNYKKFSIGYLHSCLHPVISSESDLNKIYRRGSEDRIFVKIEW